MVIAIMKRKVMDMTTMEMMAINIIKDNNGDEDGDDCNDEDNGDGE